MTLSLAEIARALDGRVHGLQVLAPGPEHSRNDRSLSVKLSRSSPKGFVVHSYCGDDWRACEEYVAGALGLPMDHWKRDAAPAHDSIANMTRRVARRQAEEQEAADTARRIERAVRIWETAQSPIGTPVERYLRSRSLELPADVAVEALRFHPRGPWETSTAPMMVAALRSIHSGEITGVHRTALTSDGRKIGRKMLGVAAGAAIKLDADDAVTLGLAIGEGIETCLAARQLGFRPTWALGSVDAIRLFPVLPGIETLTALAENDENGASERACEEVGTAWHAAGRSVDIVVPTIGKDLNDAIKGRAAA